MQEHKILFIHIPKTGGTTIGNLIHPNIKIKNTNQKYSDVIHNEQLSVEHDYYSNYLDILGDAIKNYFVFSFVRNPYSRAFSLWRQCCSAATLSKNTIISCDRSLTNTKYYIHNNENKILFRKFIGCLYDEKENIHLLGNTQYSMIQPDKANFIGRYEMFERHVKTLINCLNIHIKQPLFRYKNIHLNQKSNFVNEYKEYYDPISQKQIKELFLEDFIYFNYNYDRL